MVYTNPADRRQSTLVPGVPHAYLNAYLALLSIAVFFLPVWQRARAKAASHKLAAATGKGR